MVNQMFTKTEKIIYKIQFCHATQTTNFLFNPHSYDSYSILMISLQKSFG